jgi:hypothetical protein
LDVSCRDSQISICANNKSPAVDLSEEMKTKIKSV